MTSALRMFCRCQIGVIDVSTYEFITCKNLYHSGRTYSLLSASRYADSGGAFKVQIYSPYLLLNKTGQPIRLRQRVFLGGTQDMGGQAIPGAMFSTGVL